jgi:hypothetical protein
MANDLNQSQFVKEEIDLKEIIKILLESKILIISSILIFTIASIIYSLSLKPSFISSTKLEIGYFKMSDGTQKLIETPSDLISDLNVFLLKNIDNKFNQGVSINSIEEKLLILETSSSLAEQNENLLTEIINYIDIRHSNLSALITNQKKDEVSQKINLNESLYTSLTEKILMKKEVIKLELEAEISKLQNDLPTLDQEINQLKQVIIEDTNNLNLLKGTNFHIERAASSPSLEEVIFNYKSKINVLTRRRNNTNSDLNFLSQKLDTLNKFHWHGSSTRSILEISAISEISTSYVDELFSVESQQKILENQLQTILSQTLINTHPIGDIETNTIKPQTQLIIFLGIIFGFITSVFFVLIINFIKRFKESQA